MYKEKVLHDFSLKDIEDEDECVKKEVQVTSSIEILKEFIYLDLFKFEYTYVHPSLRGKEAVLTFTYPKECNSLTKEIKLNFEDFSTFQGTTQIAVKPLKVKIQNVSAQGLVTLKFNDSVNFTGFTQRQKSETNSQFNIQYIQGYR